MLHSTTLALLFLVASKSYGQDPEYVASRLEVIFPSSFKKPNGYKHNEALFGRPHYGGSIQANVYYIDSHLCEADADYTRSGYPTRDTDETGQMARWQSPFILMMNRGNCSFVEKVRNAQHAGASAAIVADTTCLCSHGDTCQSEDPMDLCESRVPIMPDDGSGSDVVIPSFLMNKQDADLIKNSMKVNNTAVSMKMTWDLPRRYSRVEYSLWMTPHHAVSKSFLRNFGKVAKSFGDRATFVPYMYIISRSWADCFDDDDCSRLCTNKGRYCAYPPGWQSGISGVDIVKESLRRLCIWEEYGNDGIGMPWWNYIKFFIDRCDENGFTDDICVKNAMNYAGVDYVTVENCMSDSGGLEVGENSMLEKQLSRRDETGVDIVPSLYVNDVPLRGAMSSIEVFEAICAGFAEGVEPITCLYCGSCLDVIGCATSGVCAERDYPRADGTIHSSRSGIVSSHTFAFWMLLVVCSFGGIAYWHYNKTRKDMREQVRGILTEYMPLEDQDGGNPIDVARPEARELQFNSSPKKQATGY